MALIHCPECAHKISDQSTACPNCGLPNSKMILIINCPECSEPVYNQAPYCGNCGFPIAKPKPLKNSQPSYEELQQTLEELEEQQRESKWAQNVVMFIISCIIIYLIAKEEIHYILEHLF